MGHAQLATTRQGDRFIHLPLTAYLQLMIPSGVYADDPLHLQLRQHIIDDVESPRIQ